MIKLKIKELHFDEELNNKTDKLQNNSKSNDDFDRDL